MTTWTEDELRRIGNAVELQLTSIRTDSTRRPYVIMWVARTGDDLYVRSAYGSTSPWYLRAKASGVGRIRAGGIERDVIFAEADPSVQGDIDTAYHSKYDSYGPKIVGSVVGLEAHAVTIRLQPRTE